MAGDDRARFCNECNLHVYNISELTRAEAERLIVDTEGRLCARMFRRADGTVSTRDCPVGLRAIRRRAARFVTAAAVLLTTLCASAFAGNRRTTVNGRAPANSQSSVDLSVTSIKASVSGTIKDPNGDAIQKATVTLTNLETNQRQVTKANKRGEYHFSVSAFGRYSLEIKAESFQPFYQTFELHLSDELRLDVSMDLGVFVGIVTIEPVRGKGFDLEGMHVRIN